jgi:hypothetical protein
MVFDDYGLSIRIYHEYIENLVWRKINKKSTEITFSKAFQQNKSIQLIFEVKHFYE